MLEDRLLSRKTGSDPERQALIPKDRLLSRKTGSYPGRQAPTPEDRLLSRKTASFTATQALHAIVTSHRSFQSSCFGPATLGKAHDTRITW